MAAPNLTISVEPMESGKVVYAPCAPKTSASAHNGICALKLAIKNHESSAVHLNQVQVSFVGSPAAQGKLIAASLDIGPDVNANWFFATSDEIVLPHPAPSHIRIRLRCDGFDAPASLLLPLAPHQSPTAAGSYRFPARATDLRKGEYWSGLSATHAPAGDGGQLFAYDMGVIGWDSTKQAWSGVLPGKSGDKNEHFRIWGKPIYAMADGTVVDFANERENNPKPGVDLSPPDPVEGNHFYIQHGDELVLYAHFQKGSLVPSLMKKGAAVKAGEMLGLAGNSGNSSGPHLHIHAIQATKPWGGPPRPLPFNSLQVIDRSVLNPPSPVGPWVATDDRCLPTVSSAIWPESSAPTWYPPGWAEVARHGIPESNYQIEFERISKSGYRLVWIDGYEVNGDTYFNVIFRPKDGVSWVARHGLDAAGYQKAFDTFTSQGYRLMHIESYLSDGRVRFAPIFVNSPNSGFVAYHGVSANQHQKSFDDLTKDGWHPVNISAVSPSGDRIYTALYERSNVGSFEARSSLTMADYQIAFDANAKAGRHLVYLNAFTHQGSPRMSAIWHERPAVSISARHGMSSGQYQEQFDNALSSGYLTRAVTGYEEGNNTRFAGLWVR
jgi:Bacterial tandem repeat domain 1/Peptidase family M23